MFHNLSAMSRRSRTAWPGRFDAHRASRAANRTQKAPRRTAGPFRQDAIPKEIAISRSLRPVRDDPLEIGSRQILETGIPGRQRREQIRAVAILIARGLLPRSSGFVRPTRPYVAVVAVCADRLTH